MRVRTDRVERFAFDRDELWTRIAQVPQFPAWWPWLRDFDGVRLCTGEVWHCAVRPPARYTVRFTVTIVQTDPGATVSAQIDGDIVGTASVQLAADGTGSTVRLVTNLAPASWRLRVLAFVAWPVARRGHDRVIAIGVRQFRERSGRSRAAQSGTSAQH